MRNVKRVIVVCAGGGILLLLLSSLFRSEKKDAQPVLRKEDFVAQSELRLLVANMTQDLATKSDLLSVKAAIPRPEPRVDYAPEIERMGKSNMAQSQNAMVQAAAALEAAKEAQEGVRAMEHRYVLLNARLDAQSAAIRKLQDR